MLRRLAVLTSLVLSSSIFAAAPQPPVAPKKPHQMTVNGDTRDDEYFWMRDKANPDVIKHLEAENAYTDAMTAGLTDLKDKLYNEFLSRIKQTDETAPAKDGGYWYFSRTIEGKNYPIYCRRMGSATGPEQAYLDVNALAEGHEFFNITEHDVSPDGKYLAYLVDETGYESCTLKFRDLETGKDLPDQLKDIGPFSLTWAASEGDQPVVFFTRVDETKRTNRVIRYRLGDGPEKETEIYRENDVKFDVGVGRTRSDAYVLISSNSSTTTEILAVDAHKPDSAPKVLRKREQGVRYEVDHQVGQPQGFWWYITDQGGAMNFKVMKAPENTPDKWTEVVPASKDVLIEGVSCFDGYVVLSERRGGFTALDVMDLAKGTDKLLQTPEPVGVIGLNANYEYTTPTLRIGYQSPVTPSSVYDVDLASGNWTLIKRTEVLGGYDPSRYEVKRLYATAPDGVKVPMSVVHLKGITLDGTNPGYLYGYGSYGISTEPAFRSNIISMLDRGVVCAVAHVRGGSEMGRAWKEDGKLNKKINTFTDFIACAEELIKQKYTSPTRLAIEGGSAGGLLIGAVVNMRPDLFEVAHAAVPFVDVLTTMLDSSIPLTTGEYEEWGNPNESDAYRYIKSYSPYDNVGRKDYPNILITSGLNDSRVAYWEPSKWTAKLRELSTGHNPILLKMNMGAGHGGSSGRYERMKEVAFEWSFLLDKIGAGSLEPAKAPARKTEPVGAGS